MSFSIKDGLFDDLSASVTSLQLGEEPKEHDHRTYRTVRTVDNRWAIGDDGHYYERDEEIEIDSVGLKKHTITSTAGEFEKCATVSEPTLCFCLRTHA
jgi:hypothetical protein